MKIKLFNRAYNKLQNAGYKVYRFNTSKQTPYIYIYILLQKKLLKF